MPRVVVSCARLHVFARFSGAADHPESSGPLRVRLSPIAPPGATVRATLTVTFGRPGHPEELDLRKTVGSDMPAYISDSTGNDLMVLAVHNHGPAPVLLEWSALPREDEDSP